MAKKGQIDKLYIGGSDTSDDLPGGGKQGGNAGGAPLGIQPGNDKEPELDSAPDSRGTRLKQSSRGEMAVDALEPQPEDG